MISRKTKGLVERLVEGLVENQQKILALVRDKPHISKREMSERIGISSTAIDKNIKTLKKKGLLKRIGPAKGGYWKVVEKVSEIDATKTSKGSKE